MEGLPGHLPGSLGKGFCRCQDRQGLGRATHPLPGGPSVPARAWAEDTGQGEVNRICFLPSGETDKKPESYNTSSRDWDGGGRGRNARHSPASLAWVSQAFESSGEA